MFWPISSPLSVAVNAAAYAAYPGTWPAVSPVPQLCADHDSVPASSTVHRIISNIITNVQCITTNI